MRLKIKNKKFKEAFSLIEITLSLIVIAFITGAIVPIAMKKIINPDVKITSSSLFRINDSCHDDFGSYCSLCTKDVCLVCDNECGNAQYNVITETKDGNSCICLNCPAGCSECNNAENCSSCEAGYYLTNESNKYICVQCIPELQADNTYKYYSCPGGVIDRSECTNGQISDGITCYNS